MEGSDVGTVLTSTDGGGPLTYALALTFKVRNNEVEYEALIIDLRVAIRVGVASLRKYVVKGEKNKHISG